MKPEQRVLDHLKKKGRTAFTSLAVQCKINFYHLQIILQRLESENKIKIENINKYTYASLK